MATDDSQLVLAERHGRVGIVRLHRPAERNALSPALMSQLADALEAFDANPTVGCIVVAGSEEAFAAGADVRWLAERKHEDVIHFAAGDWPRIRAVKTPMVAAVSGWALGGGFELALSCDIVVSSDSAVLGQPEILLGIIPGAGATQRIARVAGRQRAMDLVLTGRRMSATEAYDMGLISRLVPAGKWLDAALEVAREIATRPPFATRLAKEAVQAADDVALTRGFEYERRLFELALSTDDRMEGMTAFLEKRPPVFPSLESADDSDLGGPR